MTTGEGVALAIGGVVVVGGIAYLITRKPSVGGSSPLGKVPAQQAATVGTAAIAIGSGLGGLLTTLFGPSKNNPTTANINSAPQLTQPPAQSWGGTTTADGHVSNTLGDTAAPTDPGMSGPTQSETELGITGADYY